MKGMAAPLRSHRESGGAPTESEGSGIFQPNAEIFFLPNPVIPTG
jgi:hypothetical protein